MSYWLPSILPFYRPWMMELCEFIKELLNLHHNMSIRTTIIGIRLVYGKAQDEKGVKASNDEFSQATQVMRVQNTKEAKPGKSLRERLSESTD